MTACLAVVAHRQCSVDSWWLVLTLARACGHVSISSYWLACWEKMLLCSVIQNTCRKVVATPLLCESETLPVSVQFSALHVEARDCWQGQSRCSHLPEDLTDGMAPHAAHGREACARTAPVLEIHFDRGSKIIQRIRVHMPNPVCTYASLPLCTFIPHLWANTRPAGDIPRT